jgi:hypothetical protein
MMRSPDHKLSSIFRRNIKIRLGFMSTAREMQFLAYENVLIMTLAQVRRSRQLVIYRPSRWSDVPELFTN